MGKRHGLRMFGAWAIAAALAAAGGLVGFRTRGAAAQEGGEGVKKETSARRLQVVEACIVGTHAYQMILHQKTKKGDDEAFSAQGLGDGELDALVQAHRRLAATDAPALAAWASGKASTFDPADALEPLLKSRLKLDEYLPVSVATKVLAVKAPKMPQEKVRALASLLQVCLESDRDGEMLQEMFRLYIPLGLLVAPTELGVEDSNRAFLALGTELAADSCKAPFATSRAAWQIALRKIQNWSQKHTRDMAAEYADELLGRDDIRPIVDRVRSLPPQRVLVIGHSFTMMLHWSTGAPMNEIVAAVFKKLNPKVVFGHMGIGGMRAWQARDRFLADALAWKPDRVLIVTVVGEDRDFEALEEMTTKLKAAGAEVIVFDQIYTGRETWINTSRERLAAVARKTGLTVLEVGRLLGTHPERSDFVCLDGIHMRPSYHKFMAGELLKYLVGAREAKLPAQ